MDGLEAMSHFLVNGFGVVETCGPQISVLPFRVRALAAWAPPNTQLPLRLSKLPPPPAPLSRDMKLVLLVQNGFWPLAVRMVPRDLRLGVRSEIAFSI